MIRQRKMQDTMIPDVYQVWERIAYMQCDKVVMTEWNIIAYNLSKGGALRLIEAITTDTPYIEEYSNRTRS